MTNEEIIDKHHNLNLGLLSITEKQIYSAMDAARQDEAILFASWLNETNWGEKETWGKNNPPSIPSIKQLYQLFKSQTNG